MSRGLGEGLVHDYLASHKVMISYVRDVYGFKKGVVVAIGKNKIGWSLVHSAQDIRWARMKPQQLPAVQRMYHLKECSSDIMYSKAYQTLLNNYGEVKIPLFSRKRGLEEALDKAINGVMETKFFPDTNEAIFVGNVTSDQDLINVMTNMARKAYWSQQWKEND